eukprot:3994946-Pyramimonas_sp.AAC.1
MRGSTATGAPALATATDSEALRGEGWRARTLGARAVAAPIENDSDSIDLSGVQLTQGADDERGTDTIHGLSLEELLSQ